MILVGDFGGTKTNLALFQPEGAEIKEVQQDTFPSRAFPSLEAVIQHFLQTRGPSIRSACFGVSGLVIKGRGETTNLAWTVDSKKIAQQFGISTVFAY